MKKVLKIIVIMLFIFSAKVWANEVKVKNYKFQNNIEMNGVYNVYSTSFYVDGYWKINDESYVYLNMNVSEMIKYKNSSLVVFLNNQPVGSIEVGNGQKNIQRAINIPGKYIKGGFNEFKIVTYKFIDNNDCKDFVNPANYIDILNDSYIHIEYTEEESNITLKDFPYPLFKRDGDEFLNSLIVVDKSKEAYLALLYLSSALGKANPYSNVDLNIKYFSEMTKDDFEKNIIFISQYRKLDEKLKQFITIKDIGKMSNAACIKLVKSPYKQGKYILIITAFDEEKLAIATRALGDEDFISSLNDSVCYVNDYDKKFEQQKKEKLTLKDLGYEDFSLNNFSNEATFAINIPREYSLKKDAYLELAFRYSSLLDFKKSSILVYINGKPYKDKKLNLEFSNKDTLRVNLSEFKDNSYLEFKVKFYLYPRDGNCLSYFDTNLFATLLSSSLLNIPTEYKVRRDFRYYPAPFVEGGKFNNLNVVITDDLKSYEVTALANIFAYLGHSISVLDGLSVDYYVDINKNNLIYGKNEDATKKFKEILPIYLEDGYSIKEGIDISLSNDDAILEIADVSDENKFVAAFIVNNNKNIRNIEKYLKDFDFVARLNGDVCIINSSGNLRSYNVANDHQNIWYKNKSMGVFVAAAFGILLIILIFKKKK